MMQQELIGRRGLPYDATEVDWIRETPSGYTE
jgi:hypothetical protein